VFAIGERKTSPKEIPKFLNYKVSPSSFFNTGFFKINHISSSTSHHQSKITLKRSKNSKTYFLILDQDTNLVYYAFPNFTKKGEHELTTNFFKVQPQNLKFWVKFEEGLNSFKSKRVVEFRVEV